MLPSQEEKEGERKLFLGFLSKQGPLKDMFEKKKNTFCNRFRLLIASSTVVKCIYQNERNIHFRMREIHVTNSRNVRRPRGWKPP